MNIDRDELIEILKVANGLIETGDCNTNQLQNGQILFDSLDDLAKFAELTKARANQWIDCSVELPDYESVKQKRLRVVVFWPETNGVFTLWYGHRFCYNSPSFFEEYEWTESDLGEIDENDNPFLGESLTYSGITHWQHLPLPLTHSNQ